MVSECHKGARRPAESLSLLVAGFSFFVARDEKSLRYSLHDEKR